MTAPPGAGPTGPNPPTGPSGPTDDGGEVYPYAVDYRFAPMWLAFGFVPGRDAVRITADGDFVASFGLARVRTPLENIDGAHVTRDYRWWTAIGVRLSFADDGLTFGTNTRAGVCVHFREKVPGVLPVGRRGHSALTVTVADLQDLVARLGRS
ncbi:MAG TPA: hypothetical protein VE991_07435 [Acidimicrobiales bacterium]|nr:hypothetical protein [Acidimicrobiales bacterium]